MGLESKRHSHVVDTKKEILPGRQGPLLCQQPRQQHTMSEVYLERPGWRVSAKYYNGSTSLLGFQQAIPTAIYPRHGLIVATLFSSHSATELEALNQLQFQDLPFE
jgi:hypothetical protein